MKKFIYILIAIIFLINLIMPTSSANEEETIEEQQEEFGISEFIQQAEEYSGEFFDGININELLENGGTVEEAVKKLGIVQISDSGAIEEIVKKIVENNPDSVKDYKEGKDRAIKFLMGQVMKETKGQANPKMAMDILQKELSK